MIYRYAEAQTVITKGLAIAPDDYFLLCLMSLSFIQQENWKDALQYAKKAVESNPEDSWSHRLLAITYKNGGRRHEAVKAAKKAVKLDAYDPANWHTLASTQLQIYDLKAARETTEKLLEIAPDWSLTHQMFSLIALGEENYKEAEIHCRRELELDPTSYTGLNNLGVTLMNQGRKREAIEIFNRAAKLAPNEYHAKGNLESAVSQYIPQIGIGIGAIWIVVQGLRILENINPTLAVAGIVLIASAALIFFVFRKWRYSTLPKETKDYMNYLK